MDELPQPLLGAALQMQSQDRPLPGLQGFQVSQGLGSLQQAKSIRQSGDGKIGLIVCRDLHKEALGGASFVKLSGGVQIARAVAQCGSQAGMVTQRMSQRLELPVMFLGWIDVGL